MPFAIVFILFAGLCVAAAIDGGWRWLWLWPAGSFALIAWAYLRRQPRWMGKRVDGSIHPLSRIFHLPSHLLAGGTWHLASFIRGSKEHSLISHRIWVGRRPTPRDLPADVTLVVDLTCEFPLHRGLRNRCRYRSFPILDGHVPAPQELVSLAQELAAEQGTLYIHCAQGHGRAAMVAASVLLARGEAKDARDALRIIRLTRPNIRLSPAQRAMLDAVAAELQNHRAR